MSPDQQLHDRATRGEALTAEEQARLDQWYTRQDQEEAAALAGKSPQQSTQALQAQVDAAVAEISDISRQIQSQMEARQLLVRCEISSRALEKAGQLLEGFLDRGMERRQLSLFVRKLLDSIESGIKSLDVAHTRVKVADLMPEEKADGLGLLERVSRRSAEMRDELSGLLRWLETPRPHIDPSALPGGRGDRDAQGYVNLDDLTTRLLGRDT